MFLSHLENEISTRRGFMSRLAASCFNERITGRALPFCVWSFFLVPVILSTASDARGVSLEALSLQSLLAVARGILSTAFVLLISISYLVRIRAAEKARGFWERRFPMWVLVASMVGMGLLQSHSGTPPVYLAGAGLVLAISGAALSIWSIWHLRASFSVLVEARRTVISGPYRYVRHPLYLGEILNILGICLMIGTGAALLFWLLITACQLARARFEEEKLSRALSDYQPYRTMTPFIVPSLLPRLH